MLCPIWRTDGMDDDSQIEMNEVARLVMFTLFKRKALTISKCIDARF